MNASERPIEIKNMFEVFYRAVDNERYTEAKAILQSIEEIIGPEDTELVGAHVTLDFAEM